LIAQGVEVVVGDITDVNALQDALKGITTVYHLAGRLFTPGVPWAEYYTTHVEGTCTLLSCCEDEPGLKRFVHCSTTGVLGVTGDQRADENTPFRPTNAYEQTKAEAEVLVSSAQSSGFPAVIVRPGLVYGPGDLHLLGFFRSIQRRLFRPIGRHPVWLHPVYIDDMTEALIRCGRLPQASWECFHIAGRHPVTIAQLADAIGHTIGARPTRGWIPLAAALPLATAGDFLPARLRHLAPLTRSRLDFLTHSRVYDVTKAERILGFSASISLTTGLARTVSWYAHQGYLSLRDELGPRRHADASKSA
jgi:nucleoside-diphosphate-sugar epimerase